MSPTAALIDQLEERLDEVVDTYGSAAAEADDVLLAVAKAREESLRLGMAFAVVLDPDPALVELTEDWTMLLDVLAEEVTGSLDPSE